MPESPAELDTRVALAEHVVFALPEEPWALRLLVGRNAGGEALVGIPVHPKGVREWLLPGRPAPTARRRLQRFVDKPYEPELGGEG